MHEMEPADLPAYNGERQCYQRQGSSLHPARATLPDSRERLLSHGTGPQAAASASPCSVQVKGEQVGMADLVCRAPGCLALVCTGAPAAAPHRPLQATGREQKGLS